MKKGGVMKRVIFFLMPCAILFNTGCQNTKTRAVEGSVIGGIIGAAAGYGIGHQSHSGAQGAGIGAATGAIAGAIIGSQMKKPGADVSSQETTQYSNSGQLSMDEIVKFSQQGIQEDVIIDKIRLTNTKYILTAQQIDYLQKQGVSQRVIFAMQGM